MIKVIRSYEQSHQKLQQTLIESTLASCMEKEIASSTIRSGLRLQICKHSAYTPELLRSLGKGHKDLNLMPYLVTSESAIR